MQAMQPGNAPSSAIQPGVIGGGALPSVASPTLAASLALLPLGLAAVAVFPPFATPRTFPAVAVIFSEDGATNRRFKRYISQLHKARNGYYTRPRESVFKRIARKIKRLYDKFHKRMACLEPRLARKFGRKAHHRALYSMGRKKRDYGHDYYFNDYDEFKGIVFVIKHFIFHIVLVKLQHYPKHWAQRHLHSSPLFIIQSH